jgi:hypothetical protein
MSSNFDDEVIDASTWEILKKIEVYNSVQDEIDAKRKIARWVDSYRSKHSLVRFNLTKYNYMISIVDKDILNKADIKCWWYANYISIVSNKDYLTYENKIRFDDICHDREIDIIKLMRIRKALVRAWIIKMVKKWHWVLNPIFWYKWKDIDITIIRLFENDNIREYWMVFDSKENIYNEYNKK